MDTTVIFQQMLILVLLMAVGYVVRRLKIIDDSANAVMTKLLLRVTVPATLIYSIASRELNVERRQVPLLFLIIIISFAIVGVISWLAPLALRAKQAERGAYADMALFGNVNFMSIPLIIALISAEVLGSDAMLHAILYNIVFNLTIFSLGMKLIGGKQAKLNAKLFFSPVMIGGLLAILIFMLGVQVPATASTALDFTLQVLFRPIGFLGAMTAPMSMILLGSILGGMKLAEMFRGWRIYAITAVRLAVAPVAVYFALLPFSIDPTLLQVIIIMNASPMAISVAMFTINYGVHKEIVGKGIFISTLLSVLTMPLLLSVLV